MPKIFVSYRRGGTAAHAGRIADRLKQAFGADNVFLDVETMRPGLDFVEAIEQAVGACEILLVVIGRDWSTCVDPSGGRRLEDPNDFVRREAALALARNIRVIPILVERAEMPSAEVLPDDLKPLLRRQALELRDTRWDADVDALIATLGPQRRTLLTKPNMLLAALAAVGGIGAVVWLLNHDSTPVNGPDEVSHALQPDPSAVKPSSTLANEEPKKRWPDVSPGLSAPAIPVNDVGRTTAPDKPVVPKIVPKPNTAAVPGVSVDNADKPKAVPKPPAPPKRYCAPQGAQHVALFSSAESWRVLAPTVDSQFHLSDTQPCGSEGLLRLKLSQQVGYDGAGLQLDFTNPQSQNWTGRTTLHAAVRVDPSTPNFEQFQVYIQSGDRYCEMNLLLKSPNVFGGEWQDLPMSLGDFESNQCKFNYADVRLLGIKILGAGAGTTLYIGQLWLE